MKVLIDMNLSPEWVEFLRASGHEASHWSTLGSPSATDTEIMAAALSSGMVVLTHDLDFSAILASTRGKGPSVIQVRADRTSPQAIGPIVLSALTQMKDEIEAGALLTVDPSRARLRVLPLARG